jgi:hypothetical protein
VLWQTRQTNKTAQQLEKSKAEKTQKGLQAYLILFTFRNTLILHNQVKVTDASPWKPGRITIKIMRRKKT